MKRILAFIFAMLMIMTMTACDNNENKTRKNKTYKCEYKNGKYYDKNGNIVNKVNYIKSCQAPKCEIVDGYYFGKKGDVVTSPLVGLPGFEPRMTGPESVVLPLHHSPMLVCECKSRTYFFICKEKCEKFVYLLKIYAIFT